MQRILVCIQRILRCSKKSGDREDPGSFTACLHLCIFVWSSVNGLYFQILLQPLCALGEIKLHQALTEPELWPYKNSAHECLQQSRAGRATRVLWSWGSRAFQHLHMRNKRQTVPRTRTQAQGKQARGARTDEEETLKS